MSSSIRCWIRFALLVGLTVLAVVESPEPALGAEQPAAEIPAAEDRRSSDRCLERGCLEGGSQPEPGAVDAWAEFEGPGSGGTRVIPVGSSVFAGCHWDRLTAGDELLVARPDVASVNITGSTFDEDHWIIYCPRVAGFGAYTIFPVGDPPPVPIIQDMIADAYARTPVVAFNPITSPDGDDAITLITQMTTFLWVDETAWNTPVTATATLPLPVAPFSVTTTATPREAYWTGGDEGIWCDGDDMHPYVFGIGGDDAQPSDCTMIYTRSSALQDNTINLDVTWDVSYTCSIPPCGGPLPDITTTSTRAVVVGEIQAVVTRPRTP